MTHCQDAIGLPPLLTHQLKHYASMDASAAKGLCLHTCQELRKWFPAVTLVCGAVEWSGDPIVHWWLEYEGRVIDPTRQQFGASPVVFWRAKTQPDQVDGFWREVGDYAKAHPEASKREVLSALCDAEPAYQDDGDTFVATAPILAGHLDAVDASLYGCWTRRDCDRQPSR